jgi:hypothetical protein
LYKERPGTSGRIAALTSAKPGMLDRRISNVAKKAAASAPTAFAGTSPAPPRPSPYIRPSRANR